MESTDRWGYLGVTVEVIGDKPKQLGNWLWDFDARELSEQERTDDSPHARASRRGAAAAARPWPAPL